MSDHKGKPMEGEIVTPAQLDRILGQSQEPDIPALDALLQRFERLLSQSLKVTDIDTPEGWISELFGGMDYRIAVKTERGRALYGLIDTFVNNLDQFEKVEQKIRAIHRAQYDRHIDRIKAARAALEEQQKLEAVAANARLQRQLEQAKVEAEIETYKKQVRDAQNPPQAPAPRSEPPKVDEHERKRREAQRERKFAYALKIDEVEAEEEYQDKLTGSVTARILKTFADPVTVRAQKRMRIRNLVDTYGLAAESLPPGVLELLQEEEERC